MQRSSRLALGGVIAVFVLLIAAPLLGSLVPSGQGADGQAGDGGADVTNPTAAPDGTEPPDSAGTDGGSGDGDADEGAGGDGVDDGSSGEGDGTDGESDREETVRPTATATPVVDPPVVTETATATPESDPALRSESLTAAIASEINAQRTDRGLGSLATDGTTVRQLNAMAANHSETMAELGYATHYSGDNRSADRYRRNDLFDRCRFENGAGEFVITAEYDQLEVVSAVDASGYTDQYSEPDELSAALAADVVRAWFGEESTREKLSYRNAERFGVGVEITADDRAYIVVTLC